MKFSQKKKRKMRKRNQARINRCHKYMIGHHIYDYDDEKSYEVVDQAKINDIMYLLVETENEQYAIYKIIKYGTYVRVSPKRVLQNQKKFSNHAYWEDHSTIEIAEDGTIESVKFGTLWGPYNMRSKKGHGVCIIVIGDY